MFLGKYGEEICVDFKSSWHNSFFLEPLVCYWDCCMCGSKPNESVTFCSIPYSTERSLWDYLCLTTFSIKPWLGFVEMSLMIKCPWMFFFLWIDVCKIINYKSKFRQHWVPAALFIDNVLIVIRKQIILSFKRHTEKLMLQLFNHLHCLWMLARPHIWFGGLSGLWEAAVIIGCLY